MRRFSVILVVLFLLLSVVGCRQEAEVKLEVAECAHLLSETIAFQDSLTAVSDEMATVLYRLNEADVAAKKVYVSTGATAEEIAVFEAVDKEAAARIKEAVLQRAAEQEAAFRDYLPAEVPKLQKPYLYVVDRYVIFCVSNHNEAVKTAVEELLASN
ncbi:MAG: DUF4358 domain-containing protein [Firmicutes bacterium]|nr:DUF4358 domain-containing protein [Bacillota bacterium]